VDSGLLFPFLSPLQNSDFRRFISILSLRAIRQISGTAINNAMQMNGCRHLVPLYPYHATNYDYDYDYDYEILI